MMFDSEQEVYSYLDKMLAVGKQNVYKAAPLIQKKFSISLSYAQDILIDWLLSFEDIPENKENK